MSLHGKIFDDKCDKEERYERIVDSVENIKSKVKEGKDNMEHGWEEMKDRIKKKWDRFSSDDLNSIGGDMAKVIRLLQDRYGYAKDQAEEEYNEFKDSFNVALGEVKHNKIFGSTMLVVLGSVLAFTSLMTVMYMRKFHASKK